jgi:redox-sensitive bicupin YhaK (pirin superfamily)
MAASLVTPDGVRVLTVPQHRPITVLQIEIDPGRAYDVALPSADRAFLYLRDGALEIGDAAGRLEAGQVAWTDPVAGADGSVLALRAPEDVDAPARLLLASGTPLREPVVARGPFVMNTDAEIVEAFSDFRSGRFGAMPRLARVTA